jgi:L-amino acid N-acyltransferase YncA
MTSEARLANQPAMNLNVRDAVEADLPAIVDIYNQSIPDGWSTADTKPITVAERVEWFRKHNPQKRPLWVAQIDGKIVAWIGLTSFYGGRPAYDATAEVSLYVAAPHRGRGIGRELKKRMIGHCPTIGVTTLLSMYFDHNEATRHLNEQFGFQTLGHLTEIAVVNGKKRGLVIGALRIPPLEVR